MCGIGTIFFMALLSVVASMILYLTVKISEALWGAKIVNSLLGNSTEGLTSIPMQQDGVGLLLSVLVVSVPPMAAMFFQGNLWSARTYSVFTPSGGRPGPQGQPADSWGGQAPSGATSNGDLRPTSPTTTLNDGATRVATPTASPHAERIRSAPVNRDTQ